MTWFCMTHGHTDASVPCCKNAFEGPEGEKCPCCGGDASQCTLTPTGCLPRMPERDTSPLGEWPSEQERDDHDMYTALLMVRKRFPLSETQTDFIARYERGDY